MDIKVYQETKNLLKKNFELPPDVEERVDREKLELILADQIQWLLENRIEQLMQIFYRLDINESKVKEILENPSDKTAFNLACLVIEREIKRAETRLKYSGRF